MALEVSRDNMRPGAAVGCVERRFDSGAEDVQVQVGAAVCAGSRRCQRSVETLAVRASKTKENKEIGDRSWCT